MFTLTVNIQALTKKKKINSYQKRSKTDLTSCRRTVAYTTQSQKKTKGDTDLTRLATVQATLFLNKKTPIKVNKTDHTKWTHTHTQITGDNHKSVYGSTDTHSLNAELKGNLTSKKKKKKKNPKQTKNNNKPKLYLEVQRVSLIDSKPARISPSISS